MTKKTSHKCFPVIDLGRCSDCRGCIEIAPNIFYYNNDMGMMEVADLEGFPADIVEEAMKNCPKKCIEWECFVRKEKP